MAIRLWNIMQASSCSWSAQKLTLGIEIEGLVQDFFKREISPPLPMQAAAEMVTVLIKKSRADVLCNVDEKALGTILSVLGGLKTNSSALNILRHLAWQGVVREEDVEAWRQLRPQAAHGHGIYSDIIDREYQLCSQLYVLFYHLVFSLIGYSGPYSDYGQVHVSAVEYLSKGTPP
jgi:hypothetical protein